MARNMSYKAIEKEVLHNSNKDCFATYGFGEPVHIHDNTTEHQGMRATLCQCAYIKPPTACLSLQEFQPTQKTPPQSSPCLLQGPRVREEEIVPCWNFESSCPPSHFKVNLSEWAVYLCSIPGHSPSAF